MGIQFNGYRSPKKSYGKHQALVALHRNQNAFQTSKSARADSHSIAGFQVRPRLSRQPRLHHSLNRLNLFFRHSHRRSIESYDLDNAGSLENGQAPEGIKSAEEVAGEQSLLQLFPSVRPVAHDLALWQQAFVSLRDQMPCGPTLLAGAHLQRKPGKGVFNEFKFCVLRTQL